MNKIKRFRKEMLNVLKMDWQYLKYVLRHKRFVYQEGRKLGVGRWALIIHDWQKFTPAEWWPYVLSFYGPWKYDERPPSLVYAFDKAWLHHQHHGPHHYQYWILNNDDGTTRLLDMPDRYRREMLADWRGAGLAITGEDNTRNWYLERRARFPTVIHPNTLEWLDEQLGITPADVLSAYTRVPTNGRVRASG